MLWNGDAGVFPRRIQLDAIIILQNLTLMWKKKMLFHQSGLFQKLLPRSEFPYKYGMWNCVQDWKCWLENYTLSYTSLSVYIHAKRNLFWEKLSCFLLLLDMALNECVVKKILSQIDSWELSHVRTYVHSKLEMNHFTCSIDFNELYYYPACCVMAPFSYFRIFWHLQQKYSKGESISAQ